MVRGQRNHAKEQHWRRQVAGWRRSGDSVRAYCQAHGLSEQSFYQWRRVLAQRDAHAAAGAPDAGAERAASAGARLTPGRIRVTDGTAATGATSPFVPVRLVPEAPSSAVEVVLRGGRVLRVADGFSVQALCQVVAALEELPC
jgi:transposase